MKEREGGKKREVCRKIKSSLDQNELNIQKTDDRTKLTTSFSLFLSYVKINSDLADVVAARTNLVGARANKGIRIRYRYRYR